VKGLLKVLATYLIGVREGIEAAIIISILVGYVVKLGEKHLVPRILGGAGVAVLISIGLGFGLSGLEAEVSEQAEVAITGATSLLAVVFVTWMIFWMAKQARALSTNLRSQVDAALVKSTWSLAAVAFLAVIREGVESSILIWSAVKTTNGGLSATGGAFLGLGTAAILGYLMYRGALKFNIGKFFRYTGAYLVVLAAGIFAYGIGEFQELGFFPILTAHTYDVSAILPENSIPELILVGTIGFNTAPTMLQSLAWLLYLVPVGYLYLAPKRSEGGSSATANSAAKDEAKVSA
jgi:high-affinity iron transporter